jgi:folate-binding protein YgfZ
MSLLTKTALPSLTALTLQALNNHTKESSIQRIQHFLQGQLTVDMNELLPTQSRWFAHCNLQGRMVSLGRILPFEESYLLILPQSIAATAAQHLEKYAAFSKIIVRERLDLSFFGLRSDEPLNRLPEEPETLSAEGETTFICLQNRPFRWLGIHPKDKPYIDFTPSIEGSESEWLCDEIANFSPFLTPETVGKFLPHDIDLPAKKGVSFKKGCFLGQEIVARMEHLGKLKKKMGLEILPEDAFTQTEDHIVNQLIHPITQERYRLTLKKTP